MTDKPYSAQAEDTSCFVVAVANCLIHLGLSLPDMKKAVEVAGCQYGSTIHTEDVVEFMGAPLKPTRSRREYTQVFKHGGVLTIMHPIVNGHALFVAPDPDDRRLVVAVNSWLGPNVFTVSHKTLEKYIMPRCHIGCHWVIDWEKI